ncbi:MAG: glycosyltransferase [Candidatus Bathyarchaeota archaeon]|nr:glycosyltransferase [Candidatus Bathyarchaeota archaeon]
MAKKIGVFCPTLNVYGGGEFVAIALANTLAQNNHDVILFTNGKVDPKAIKNYFGEPLHPSIQTIVQPTNFTSRGLADFYQTIIHSYIAKAKCDMFVDAFSNCVFPWTQVSYIHFPYLNRYAFSKTFPYLGSPHLYQVGTVPHVMLEKNLIDYSKRLVLANSYYTAGEIRKYSGKAAQVLYPPFSSSISNIGKTATKNMQENLVVTVSRLEPSKLLDRIPQIAAQTDRTIQFAVVGRLCSKTTLTNLESVVKKLGLTDRVKFYPNASAEQKMDLLKRAKIYLHTMVGEHFGISIVEAMALGCVPIVHNSGGMTEFVPQQYRYENLQEAAGKISLEIGNWSTQKADEMKQIADRFSIANFSLRFMELFSKSYD